MGRRVSEGFCVQRSDRYCLLMSGVAELLSASLEVLLFMQLVSVSKWRSRGLDPDVL